jgi:hypothetical protein
MFLKETSLKVDLIFDHGVSFSEFPFSSVSVHPSVFFISVFLFVHMSVPLSIHLCCE